MRMMLFAAAVLAAVVSSGCGNGPRGRLHGTITWQGKPLTGATVVFLDKENRTCPTRLKSDGSYEAGGVALGPVKVSVQQDLPAVASKGESFSNRAKGVLDEKAGKGAAAFAPAALAGQKRLAQIYADAEKSGLAFELTESDQEWSVDLK